MSQDELALAVDASVRAISDWENDRRKPRNRTGALEEVLGVSLSEDGERSPPVRLREKTREAIRDDLRDDPVLAEQVIAYVEGLASGRIPAAPAVPDADPRAGGESRPQRRA